MAAFYLDLDLDLTCQTEPVHPSFVWMGVLRVVVVIGPSGFS